MKSVKLTVKGIVQKVGYRNTVYRSAKELGIKGYIKNLDDSEESVEILVQCSNPNLLPVFIGKINIKDSLIVVKEIHQTEVNANPYKKFEIIRGDAESENAERLDVAAYQLADLKQTTAVGFSGLGNRMDSGFSGLGNRMDSGFSGLGNRMDSGFYVLDTTLVAMRTDLKDFNQGTSNNFKDLDVKYGKISDKLESISDSLKKLVVIAESFTPHFKSNRAH